jgi:hypothetical protein
MRADASALRRVLERDPALPELAALIGLSVEELLEAVASGVPPRFAVPAGYSLEADRAAVRRAVERARLPRIEPSQTPTQGALPARDRSGRSGG